MCCSVLIKQVTTCAYAATFALLFTTVSADAQSKSAATKSPKRTQLSYQDSADGSYSATYPNVATPSPESDRVTEADKSDDDGPRLFWLMPAGGFQSVNMTTFQAEDEESFTADLAPTVANGPSVSLGLGLRLLALTLGARGSVAFLSNNESGRPVSDMRLWNISGELGFRFIPNPKLEPYLLLGGGYSVFTGFDAAKLDGRFKVRGPNARIGLGLDYYASDRVSIGALVLGEALFLTRPGVSAGDLLTPERVETLGEARARVLEADGTSVGTAFSVSIGPGFHF